MKNGIKTIVAILLLVLFSASVVPTVFLTAKGATTGWMLVVGSRDMKAYPDLKETVWQKNASMSPNGQYDTIALHRLVKPGTAPIGVVFLVPGLYGNGESLVSNPSTDSYTKTENMSQGIYWANRGFDVYTIDYRQHFIPIYFNKSQLAFTVDWGLDQVMSDIKECVDKAKDVSGTQKMFMAGQSWGGILVQYYAAKYWQQDLQGLVLLDPGPSKSTPSKSANMTSSVNVTAAVNSMNTLGNWAWENNQQSNTPSSAGPGYIFLVQLAASNPGAPAQYANGTLITTINPRTNQTWANITEFFEYAFNSAKSSNTYGGYCDMTTAINRAAAGDRYYPYRQFVDIGAMVDWPICPFMSFDYALHINEINVPVIAFRSGLNLAAYGNIANGMATKDFTWSVLPNYGHGDVFYGTYSAKDVSQPVLSWMLDRLSTPPTIDQNTFMTSAKTVNSGSGAVQSVFAQGATVKFAFNLQSLGSEGRVVYRVTIQQPDLVAFVVSSSAIVSASQGLQWTTFMLPSGTPKGTWSGQIQVYAADGITALAVKTLYFAVT